MNTQHNINISVIVPFYTVDVGYFKECLDSLTSQENENLEFIIVSDGAPEELCDIVTEYSICDPRIKLLRQEKSGVSIARNYGVDNAKGEYIVFVDADDYLGKKILKQAYKYAKENGSDILIWDCTSFNNLIWCRHSISYNNVPEIDINLRNEILKFLVYMEDKHLLSSAGPWCKLYRRDVLKKYRFRKQFTLSQDRVLNYEIYSDTKLKLSYLNEEGYYYRTHPESNISIYRPDLFEIYIRYISEISRLSNGKYPMEIGRETWETMWRAWNRTIFHPHNKEFFYKKISSFIKLTKPKEFRYLLNEVKGEKDMTLKSRLVLFCIRHSISLPFWLYAIEFLLMTKIKKNN